MKKINNYWTDENNNIWNADIYTKKEAQEYSESLINCSDCSDCSDCRGCRDCRYCSDCYDCHGCNDCHGSSYCRDCSDCYDCSGCSYCRGCRGYNINPQKYTTPQIGRRKSNTTIYWVGSNVQVVCGCFRGDIDAWKAAIKETHKDNDKHLKDYLKQVEIVKKIIELNA